MAEFGLMDSFKKEDLPGGWLKKFIRFSGILLVVVFIIYLGLHYGYEKVLDKQISDTENSIQSLEREISASDRSEVSLFYSQLMNLRQLLQNHIYSSQVFQRLELITHPQIAFTNFDYDFDEKRIKLDGYGLGLPAVAEQLLLFQRTTDFDKVTISDIRQTSFNRVNFSLEVFFKQGLVLDKI